MTSDIMTSLNEEYQEIKEKNYMLDFTYPTREVLRQMKSIAKVESKKMDTIQKVYKDVGNDTDITLEILKEQLGTPSIKDLIKELERFSDE